MALLLADPVLALIGLLATWKAGRLSVPLDPAHPRARVEVMLRDSEAGLVITDRMGGPAVDALLASAVRQLRIDEVPLNESVEPPGVTVSPDNRACLLYTSG